MPWSESAQDLNRLENSLSQTVEAAASAAHQPGTGVTATGSSHAHHAAAKVAVHDPELLRQVIHPLLHA